MSLPELDNLVRIGKLKEEMPSQVEFDGLIRSGQLRLEDARNRVNSLEGRFDLAYNAAHALCLAALHRHGYRPDSRYIVFQALPHTLGMDTAVWRILAKCHQRRNVAEYEGHLEVDEQLLTDLLNCIENVYTALSKLERAWMKIYGDINSGNCLKVKYTADYLGLDYDWISVDITQGESRTQEFLRMNPQGQVPVIELEDGRCLAQSNAIIRYLARETALLPGDPYLQAKVDEWLFWEQYSHEPYIAVCRFHMLYQGKPRESREPWRVERGEQALDYMENRLAGRQWLAGETFTIADIALLAYTRVAHEGGFGLAVRPQLRQWVLGCEQLLSL